MTRMLDSRSVVGFRLWPLMAASCFVFFGCGGSVRTGTKGTGDGDGGPAGSAQGGSGLGGAAGHAGRSTGGTVGTGGKGTKPCPSPLTLCGGGSCVDTLNDNNNCGSCYSACVSGSSCVN